MYDYVVVGAGSAGCILAARLTEDPNVSVALIQAGGEDAAPEIRIPAAFPTLFKSSWDWDFDSECEPGSGEPACVSAAGPDAINDHPPGERLSELLMIALYRSSRQADALHMYQQIRALLRDELGIGPGPRLCDLHQKILRSAPELSTPERYPREPQRL